MSDEEIEKLYEELQAAKDRIMELEGELEFLRKQYRESRDPRDPTA